MSTHKIEFDQIFQAINAGMIVIDHLKTVCYCNPAEADYIGLDIQLGVVNNFIIKTANVGECYVNSSLFYAMLYIVRQRVNRGRKCISLV